MPVSLLLGRLSRVQADLELDSLLPLGCLRRFNTSLAIQLPLPWRIPSLLAPWVTPLLVVELHHQSHHGQSLALYHCWPR